MTNLKPLSINLDIRSRLQAYELGQSLNLNLTDTISIALAVLHTVQCTPNGKQPRSNQP